METKILTASRFELPKGEIVREAHWQLTLEALLAVDQGNVVDHDTVLAWAKNR